MQRKPTDYLRHIYYDCITYNLGALQYLISVVGADRVMFGTDYGRTSNVEHQESGMLWALDNWLYMTFNTFRSRWTPGGVVKSRVLDGGKTVRVEMGQVSFWSDKIPVTGPRREVLNEEIIVGDRAFRFCAATIGNPHCVVPLPEISAELAKHYGPSLETHSHFPKRTNVQFLKVLDRKNIQIEIWERGAGYTLASGSSSSAAAAVARKLGLCEPAITVRMPGGKIFIEIGDDFSILMTGPVIKVSEGAISEEIFAMTIPG